jgi:hypothetical protein
MGGLAPAVLRPRAVGLQRAHPPEVRHARPVLGRVRYLTVRELEGFVVVHTENRPRPAALPAARRAWVARSAERAA